MFCLGFSGCVFGGAFCFGWFYIFASQKVFLTKFIFILLTLVSTRVGIVKTAFCIYSHSGGLKNTKQCYFYSSFPSLHNGSSPVPIYEFSRKLKKKVFCLSSKRNPVVLLSTTLEMQSSSRPVIQSFGKELNAVLLRNINIAAKT